MADKVKRLKRARKTRANIALQNKSRLVVFKSASHIYAQIIDSEVGGSKVLASASTLDSELKGALSGTKSEKAYVVGQKVAERAKKAGIKMVAFDRSGFAYHGRVKSLADGARESGLEF